VSQRRALRSGTAERSLLRVLLPCVLVVGLAAGGCVAWSTPRLTLPAGHRVVRGQLVIHSDFPLASSHRLFEELTARRRDLVEQLAIPVSDEPIHVYLFDNADRFGKFVRLYHPDFPERRAFFLETDTRLQVYAQWGDRVAGDLRHEVTHGYVHSVVPNLPLWLDEGLAEYAEAPRGRHGLHGPHLEQLVGRLAEGRWQPDLARLEKLDPAFDMSQEDYAESWAWVHFLLETHSDHRDLIRGYLRDLRRYGSAEPVSVRLHARLREPDRALIEYVRHLAEASRR
jgi:hypothetical protein